MGLFLLLSCINSMTLANYNLNFADTSSYTITCGKLTSWWTVKNDSCILYTSYMRVELDSSVLTCDFRLNQSGNLDLDDNAYIQYQINEEGWVTDTSISGYGLDAVWFRTFPLTLYYGDYVQFRIIFEINENTEFWGLQNGDINISGNFEVYSEIPSPLPVEFIYVECVSYMDAAIINWASASETNNDYFTVEHSENGTDFLPIGILEGAGNSNTLKEYSFIALHLINEMNYYRIKQTDYDGQFSYSDIVTFKITETNEKVTINLENNYLNIHLVLKSENEITLSIYDLNGSILMNEKYDIPDGNNHLIANIDDLSGGYYIMELSGSAGTNHYVRPFIK